MPGTFSLFLCVGIGIRFLLKPDTQKEKPVKKGAKLDWKGIAISLFFGLTIGFGTGFMGSGGGIMMLVVFTAFLGMERKSAVGTSTLIKTFTALIAFVSHARPLFHSNLGFQYTSKLFKSKLDKQGMTQSMSRVGRCIDNGPMEGFWGILKCEMFIFTISTLTRNL